VVRAFTANRDEIPRRIDMKIEYFHASHFGNGANVAEDFKRRMTAQGIEVDVHHVRESKPQEVPPADLYIFSSPGRFGKPIGEMRNFLKKAELPSGSRYGVLTTEIPPPANKKPGHTPSEEDMAKWQRVMPTIDEILLGKGLVKVAGSTVFVTHMKGPLEEGWQKKVEAFMSQIISSGLCPAAGAAV
jgi:multimeric flavodoxin WrbA